MKIEKSDSEWRSQLSPIQFEVTRKKGTERPFTGEYVHHHGEGNYTCVCCGAGLFPSRAKFDSGSGWPSFTNPLNEVEINEKIDNGYGMIRVEVLCASCGAHLGHRFDDDGVEFSGLEARALRVDGAGANAVH